MPTVDINLNLDTITGTGQVNYLTKIVTVSGSDIVTIGQTRFFENSTESWVKNSLLNKTFDFENAIVNSKAGFKSIDANLHQLFDGDEDIAITFSETERKLWKKNGNLVFNWQDEMLYPTGVGTHGVYERTSIRDSVFGYVIYDLSTNSTKDSANNVSANFENRVLYSSSGSSVFDWQNEVIGSLGGNVTLAELAILGSGQAAGGGTRVLTTNNAGTVTWAASSGGGITSLNGLTGATQTFVNDTNVTIVSSGTTHTLTWAGTLADGRIASASTWNAKESALTFSTGLTRATNTITNNLSTGVSGGQTLIGGTAAGDKLVIEVTSNSTHTAARDLITLRKNSAAAASTSILMTIGDGQGLNNDEVSIYSGNNSGTSGYLLRAGATFAYFNASSSLRLQIAASDIIQLSSTTATMVQGITISDAKNIVLNTTTGTKIGTATTQKLAFWNKTPIVQPTTSITGAALASPGAGTNIKSDDTFGGYTLQQLAAIIINTGLAA